VKSNSIIDSFLILSFSLFFANSRSSTLSCQYQAAQHQLQLGTYKMAPTTSSSTVVTSSFLLSNLHCPSCVSHIQEILLALDPRPTSVSPSLVTSVVTVQHDPALPIRGIRHALESAGFDICDVTPDSAGTHDIVGKSHTRLHSDNGYLDLLLNKLGESSSGPSAIDTKLRNRHLQNCEACRLENAGKNATSSTAQPDITQNTPLYDARLSMPDNEKLLPLAVVDLAEDSQTIWQASIAIGGMTCASCAGSVKEELEKKSWVKEVVVNLISNSATINFVGEEHNEELVESIEDIGFEATIDTVVSLQELMTPKTQKLQRTVEIHLQGMYCEHCPSRINNALEIFGDKIQIEKAATLNSPITKITYTPDVPAFTIRNIIAAISDADPAIQPSIYHPPTLEERSRHIHAREQMRILIRVVLTVIIAIPTLIIGIVFMSLVSSNNVWRLFLMKPLRAGVSRAQWALFIMATPVYFLCADVFHLRALKELRALWRPGSTTPFLQRFYRFGSMNMLMSLGTSIAYISSVAQLIASGVSPPSDPSESSFYFDSVIFLTLFLLMGRLIESYSKSKTGDAVTMLGKLRPTKALLIELRPDSNRSFSTKNSLHTSQSTEGPSVEILTTVNIDFLEFGDNVKVLHGDSPPCDGIIIQGETKFDESSLTGESKLIKKALGDEIFSGTVNKESPVSMKITGMAGSSMLDQIVKAVREGQTRRAPVERIADTLTSYFVPSITLLAIVIWLIWLSLGVTGSLPSDYLGTDSGGWVTWSLQFAIAVFVVACPCGLALAAPTALFVGGGLAAKYGILVKGGGEAFEKASKLDCVVFDKTGTLTVGGEPVVTDSEIFTVDINLGPKTKEDILSMVHSLEGNSSHTIAKALVSFCKTSPSNIHIVENIEEIAGQGLKGTQKITPMEHIEIIIGNELLLSNNEVHISATIQSTLDAWKLQGKSVALSAIRTNHTKSYENPTVTPMWHLAAIFAISDPVRPESRGIIQALQRRGTDVWILSGDNQITANAIGTQLGIHSSNVIAGVLPSQKAEKIKYLQKSLKSRLTSGADHAQKRALVAMVGDGINDSPALTTADVGIAIGSGSDIAISSAEFVLVSSNLNGLVTLLELSEFVFRRIKFNFGWALVYNMVALPVAAGALYPIISHGKHVRLDPVWASLAMAASSISVVMSSLALRSKIPGLGFRANSTIHDNGAE
jgi:Cu+-exporting ATPase